MLALQVKQALLLFKEKFDYAVFYCYGNHETWCHKSVGDEVITTATLLGDVWVVLGWYHKSWDTEPPLARPPGQGTGPLGQAGLSQRGKMVNWSPLDPNGVNGGDAAATAEAAQKIRSNRDEGTAAEGRPSNPKVGQSY
ncbi:hypothetical protein AK812_SmicGene15388 [Symbiodinium microadriaticum]|uniref:Uncharacterized protein n=1 Tax=Symbiodinium microadriaticum TaxID=2951 RepID=A0A1Q9E347_SYMMI|nr:hypothetical protein AK812_SmicGene15388 [Symbiodinium microadriaticum]